MACLTRAQRRRVTMPALVLMVALLHREEQNQPPKSMKGAALLLGITFPAASGLVDVLEKRGLLRREIASEDRRVTHLRLSEGGRFLTREILSV